MKDEFSFIDHITPKNKQHSSLIKGIGDDAALYRIEEQFDEVVCVDTMVEDIHFRQDTLSPFQVGYKALAVNVSDIAAMGGIPLFYLVSIAVPPNWKEEDLYEIYKGFEKVAENYSIDLIGGDTVSTKDKLVITVTVIGKVEKGRRLLRSEARNGDIVFVTGPVGCSAAGLDILLKKTRHGSFEPEEISLIKSHQMPEPQVLAGRILAQSNFRIALNDISDGVASEAMEIAEASGVSLLLDSEKLPTISNFEQVTKEKILHWALYGGEDFQLIGTVEPSGWIDIQAKLHANEIPAAKIGTVVQGNSEVFLVTEGQLLPLKKEGYNHFNTDR